MPSGNTETIEDRITIEEIKDWNLKSLISF